MRKYERRTRSQKTNTSSEIITCKEMLAQQHPELTGVMCFAQCKGCPCDYGYAPRPEWCDKDNWYIEDFKKHCPTCWGRSVSDKFTESNKREKRKPIKDVEDFCEIGDSWEG